MEDRLRQLKRQKSLLLEHLAWLDREIERESFTIPETPRRVAANRIAEAIAPHRPVKQSLQPAVADVEAAPAEQVASDLYESLGPDTRTAAADAKRGCLILSFFAFALLGALATSVVLWY